MKIKTVTITGSDDNNTDIGEMIAISKRHPFVEWGILFSLSRTGTDRYPTEQWLERLKSETNGLNMNFSGHLCGQYTREILQGDGKLLDSLKSNFDIFRRFQLNFNSENTPPTPEFYSLIEKLNHIDFILQFNKVNTDTCNASMGLLKNISFLYDSSGGRGTNVTEYKPVFDNFFTGYAGGLSPDNLTQELIKISKAVGNGIDIWIDTESGVRTDEKLNMKKVDDFVETAAAWNKLNK